MKRKGLIGWFASVLLLTASTFSHAFIVTIEPDDYAVGADLSNVSPYVTLSSRSYTYRTGDATDKPIKATAASPGHVSPTGDLSFGYHGFYVWPDEVGAPMYGGLALTFHQEVSQVTLLANDSKWPGLSVDWVAYDRDGNRIGFGKSNSGGYGGPGETFLVDIRMDNLWAVVLGAHDAMNIISFDHLSFNVVPEPSTWMLLAPGLLALVLRRKSPAHLALNPHRQG